MTTMKSVVGVLCAFSIAQTTLANSNIVAYPKNGHSYQRIDTEKTWQDAKYFCQKEGGYLATITSEAYRSQTGVGCVLRTIFPSLH
ncbi:MAG: C-type lectin domain-containing protein [Pseudomonadota bacterium]